mmetsp:Transcript_841/g.3069  ORF Transcript_841/g.3069 Transcript_841/m.3069 type:complete len:146 (-) Transcript_841:143-580(-)
MGRALQQEKDVEQLVMEKMKELFAKASEKMDADDTPTFEEFIEALDTSDKITNGIFEFLVKETTTPSLSARRERRSEGPTARLAMASRRNRVRRANLHPLVQLFGAREAPPPRMLSATPALRAPVFRTDMETLDDGAERQATVVW